VTVLSPEQWRVLNHLYQHKLHVVRPKMVEVRRTQKVTDADVVDLVARGLVIPQIGDAEIPESLARLPRRMQDKVGRLIRLRLSAAGLRVVLDDPGNQIRYTIRYTLGQYGGWISLAKLFNGNTVVIDDVTTEQRRGLIRVRFPGGDTEIEVTAEVFLLGEFFMVALTSKGREYLPA
jgi:hypothetical protein